MDEKLFFKIYNFGQKNKSLYNICLFITKTSSTFFIFIYSILALYLLLSNDKKFVPYLAVPLFMFFLNILLRKIIHRQRPYIKHNIDITLKRKTSFCMPSNHSASSCIIACAFYFTYKPLGVLVFVCALFTGTSRIVTGLHYPFDILLAFCISLLVGIVSYIIII